MLVNNAGLTADGLGAADDERDVLQLSPEHFMGEMRINALGPMLLARGLLPALRRSGRPRIVNISSQIGSMVVGSTMGRDVGYGASKAALNMVTIKLAWRLRDEGVIAVAIHPGYLRTDMSGPGADLDPADAAVQIIDLIDGLTIDAERHVPELGRLRTSVVTSGRTPRTVNDGVETTSGTRPRRGSP